MQHEPKSQPLTGLLVASTIAILWLGSWISLLFTDISQLTPLVVLAAIIGRTFIQTGLFIVAHDAIHGVVVPANRQWNQRIGQVALMLYALLPYQKLALNHSQHHQQPGRVGDPDFHDGIHANIFGWYLKFMTGYLDNRQRIVLFFGIGVVFHTLNLKFHVPIANLFLFWIFPIVFSSMQLFVFGTYLPHRGSNIDAEIDSTNHNASSSNYHPILSFLTCYHFGYHWEHHEYPFLPWYGLPGARQVTNAKQ